MTVLPLAAPGAGFGSHHVFYTWASACLCSMLRAQLKVRCFAVFSAPSGSISCNSTLSGILDICVIHKLLLSQTTSVQLGSLLFRPKKLSFRKEKKVSFYMQGDPRGTIPRRNEINPCGWLSLLVILLFNNPPGYCSETWPLEQQETAEEHLLLNVSH